jgi:hypothetical protein
MAKQYCIANVVYKQIGLEVIAPLKRISLHCAILLIAIKYQRHNHRHDLCFISLLSILVRYVSTDARINPS